MIDSIQVDMGFAIYHFEINSVQVRSNQRTTRHFLHFLGHSIEEIRGHELFLSNPEPVTNYNGLFGR